jgi:murein DD-endopeptidase MepM/ murein hydrolase activator NlpD
MMRKQISLIVLTNSGSPAKHFNTSLVTLRSTAVALILFLCFSGYITYDYARLKQISVEKEQRLSELSERVIRQSEEIKSHVQQIGDFAQDINGLKEKLLALNQFEKKIRIMADLEKRQDSGNLFGVGGPTPRNMDPKAALDETRQSLMREMHSQIGQLNLAAVNQEDDFVSLVSHFEKQRKLIASIPTIRPVSPDAEQLVSSRFEYRNNPFTGAREFHRGIDISARDGTPIYATAAGTVTFAGLKGPLGKTIIIDHGHGLTTTYGHCRQILKLQGERVNRWDTIALVGNTGSSTGPHIHYEVALYGVQVNPEKYFLN